MGPSRRPAGVTVLTGLHIIIAIVDIFIAALLLALSVLATTIAGFDLIVFGVFLLPLALLLLAFGLVSLVLAYGLWVGKRWAWISSIIVAIVGLVAGAIGVALQSWVNIAALIFYSLILVYLDTTNVRFFFGRSGGLTLTQPFKPKPAANDQSYIPQGHQPAPSAPPQDLQPERLPGPQSFKQAFCPYCANPLRPGVNFCDRCGSRLGDNDSKD